MDRSTTKTKRNDKCCGYIDTFRTQHALEPGHAPPKDPHLRLDDVFVPCAFADRAESCGLVTRQDVRAASDHLPVLAQLRVD